MSSPTRTRDTHFPLFDALRATAALTVFTIHAIYQPEVQTGDLHWWYPFGIHLDVAVPIFFAVSGFLLYRPFVSARVRGRPLSVKTYAWRRALRILPAYWVALAIVTIWFDLDEVQSLGGVLQFGLFAQIYDADTALKGVGQAWTLNVEVTYYILLPILAALITGWVTNQGRVSFRREFAVVGAIVLGSIAWKALALSVTDAAAHESGPWLYPMPTWLDQLGMGMLLAVASVWVSTRERDTAPPTAPTTRLLRFVDRWPGAVWGVALLMWLCSVAVGPNGRDPYISDPVYFLRHLFYTLTVFFLLVPGVFGEPSRGLVRKFLATRFMQYIGQISYSFYLFHFAVIAQMLIWFSVPDDLPTWAAWYAGALAGATLLGTLGYYLVEKPLMGLKSRVPTRRAIDRESEAAQAHAAP